MRAPAGSDGRMMQSPGAPSPPQQQHYSPPQQHQEKPGFVNRMERMTGLDLDRDGDVGVQGKSIPPYKQPGYRGAAPQSPQHYSPNNQWSSAGVAHGGIPNRGQVLAQYGDLPGYALEEVVAKPHRQLSADELARYNLPAGTIMMATQQEIDGKLPIGPTEHANLASEQDQISAYLARQGLVPWTGPKAPVFAHNGQPVPNHLFTPQSPPRAQYGQLTATQQVANHNQQYRYLEQQYGKPPSPSSYNQQPQQKTGFLNKMEKMTGLDIDRDGDVGRQGKPQQQGYPQQGYPQQGYPQQGYPQQQYAQQPQRK